MVPDTFTLSMVCHRMRLDVRIWQLSCGWYTSPKDDEGEHPNRNG